MRVAHLVHTFSKLSETFIYNYVSSLQNQDLEVSVITFNHVNEDERPFSPVKTLTLPWWNISRIWNISRNKLLGKNLETAAWPVYRKKLREMLSEMTPDVIHAHFGPMGVLAASVARELGIPLVVTFYGYDISELLKEKFWVEKYREMARVASCITVLSEEMKERAIAAGFREDQINVVHLGIDTRKINYSKPNHPISRFLSIGRLEQKKGHFDTLKAFSAICQKEDRNLSLKIIGGGSMEEELKGFIAEHNLEDHVFLLGNLPNKEVIEHLQNADAFILNSKTSESGDKEGTPTVLVEAQASGLPCISTYHSGIPEMIPEPNHKLLAEEGSVDQIIDNLESLLEMSEKEVNEMSMLGRKYMEDDFDVNREAQKFASIYKNIIS